MVVEQLHQLVQQDPPQRGRIPLLDPGQPLQQRPGPGACPGTRHGSLPGGPQPPQGRGPHMAPAPRTFDGEDPVEHPQPPAGRNQ